MENWRFIEENPDYMISDHGRVLSFKGKSKLILCTKIIGTGYETVSLLNKGICTDYNVHRLIAKAFIAESKLPFIMISGSEINNAKDIKHLFLAARAKESCIIFIDEFDVMGKENKNKKTYHFLWQSSGSRVPLLCSTESKPARTDRLGEKPI